jgi:carboxypeptidase family protein/tetratricopeptide repeat protein
MYVRALVLTLSLFVSATVAICQSSIPSSSSEGIVDPLQTGPMGAAARLDSMGSISGIVMTLSGKPINRALVELHELTTGNVIASAQSSSHGNFTFSNVPTGDFEVVASLGVDQTHERVHCNRSDASVTLRLNAPIAEPGSGATVSVKSLAAPEKAQDEFRKAHQAFLKSKFADAWAFTEKALTAAPRYAQALTLRGILRLNKADTKGGEQDLQESLKADPNYALAYFAMGAALNLDGRYDDAQRTLEQGLRIEPTSWQGYFELGKTMMAKSDYRSALKYIVKAEGLQTSYAPIHLVKAHALMGLKFYDEAAMELETYIKADPSSPQAIKAKQSLEQARAFTSGTK